MIRRTRFSNGNSAAYALPILRTVPVSRNADFPRRNYAYGTSRVTLRPVIAD